MKIIHCVRLGLLCGLFLLNCILAGCSEAGMGDEDILANHRPIVTVLKVKPQVIKVSENYPARVKAFRHVEIRPQVGGIVKNRLFREGYDVKAGDALFQINDEVFQAQLSEAQANLDKAEAEAMRTHNYMNRLQTLAKSNSVTKQQFEDAESQYKQAMADIAQAKALRTKAELDITYSVIKAPISGRIGQSYVSEGALINQTDTQPMAFIQQIDKVYIDVKQPLSQSVYLEKASLQTNFQFYDHPTIEIVDSEGNPYDVKAELLFTELDVNETMGDTSIRIEVDNTQHRLRPGMYVRVKITYGEIKNGLIVPVASISRSGQGLPQVMVIESTGKSELRQVALGQALNGYYVIKTGIQAGEQVVVEGRERALANVPILIKPWNPNLDEKRTMNPQMQAQLNEIMTLTQSY